MSTLTTGTVSILGEYCGHTSVEHGIIRRSAEETTPAKKPRLEAIEKILEIDSDHAAAQLGRGQNDGHGRDLQRSSCAERVVGYSKNCT